jgi:hypothetical protein
MMRRLLLHMLLHVLVGGWVWLLLLLNPVDRRGLLSSSCSRKMCMRAQ